jgi:hypothetical protein
VSGISPIASSNVAQGSDDMHNRKADKLHVLAEIVSDNGVQRAMFDATTWFEAASDDALLALEKKG